MTTFINSLKYDYERVINLILVSALFAVLLLFLKPMWHSEEIQYFTLVLLIDFVIAMWAAWFMPTGRLVGLIIAGMLVGTGTEFTASWAGLWKYAGSVSIVAGILLYALTAVALFMLVYIVNRLFSFHRWAKITGWSNCFFVVLLFIGFYLALYYDSPKGLSSEHPYLDLVRQNPLVMAYYSLLFFLGIVYAYLMRFSLLVSIILVAAGVSLVGQYAGGTQAGIWTWLPDEHLFPSPFPPLFLCLFLWPLEYMTEYGFSAFIADIFTRNIPVRLRQRIEDGVQPEKPSADYYYPKCPKTSPGKITEKIDIAFWERDPQRESWAAFLSRYGRRAQLKMMQDSPDSGQFIAGCMVMVFLAFAVFEDPLAKLTWKQAISLSLIAALAIAIGGKLFWQRIAAFAVLAGVFGYALFAGLQLTFSGMATVSSPYSLASQFPYFGSFFWGPYCFLIFILIYGAAYILTQILARTFPTEKMTLDRGEPRGSVANASLVLLLIVLILLIVQPEFLGAFAGKPNPSFLLFLAAFLSVYTFWWYIFIAGLGSIFTQVICAFGVSFLAILVLPTQDWQEAPVSFWLQVSSMTLVYLFCYTAGASLASEPLWKGIRITYWRKKTTGGEPLPVLFHGEGPHPNGRRRVLENGVLHTYPPSRSGVNISSASFFTQPENRSAEKDAANKQNKNVVHDIHRTILDALTGLRAEWWSPVEKKIVHTVAEAVKGRKVYIKPNVVVPCGSPYTTAPELVATVAEYCLGKGAIEVHIGEIAISNITSRMSLVGTGEKVYWEGLDSRIKVHLLDEEEFTPVMLQNPGPPLPGGQKPEPYTFFMCADFCKDDGEFFVIDIPKVKTHLQSSVTLGIKNSHGLVAECERGRFHQSISQKVVDISKVWMPDLIIEDGYDALEGVGPWPGELVELRSVVLANDLVLADMVTSQLMCLEAIYPDYNKNLPFSERFIKTTWLAHEQGLGQIDKPNVIRTLNDDPTNIPLNPPPTEGTPLKPIPAPRNGTWESYLQFVRMHFNRPEWRDEQLVKNIGARFNKEPVFPFNPPHPDRDYHREYLRLDGKDPIVLDPGPLIPSTNWGPAMLIADEWRNPHVGSSVMLSGVFGLFKALMEKYFGRELNNLEGFAIVYGPLRKPLVCEGAILFGDGAVETDYLCFAPKIFKLPGYGKPPNKYSETFQRVAEELGSSILAFTTEAITFARGWYW